MVPALPAGKTAHVTVAVDLPAMFGPVSALSWGDQEHVAGLFGARVESLELSRRRSELDDFADEAELRDFLKANHPVAAAMYRRLAMPRSCAKTPNCVWTPDLPLRCLMTHSSAWSTFGTRAAAAPEPSAMIAARKRRATLANAGAMRAAA